LHHRTLAALVMLSLIFTSFTPSVSSTDAAVQRYVYLEPGYQIYIDDYSLPAPAGNFTISFNLGSLYYLYSVRAFGPENQALGISGNWTQESSTFKVTVQAGELTNFKVITTLIGTTTYSSNYTTPINFFPSINASLSATTTVRLPAGAELLEFNETGVSQSTIDGVILLSGSIQTTPGAHYYSNVTYNGTFDLLAIQSLERTIEVHAAGEHVRESFKLINVGNVKATSVTLGIPEGATNLRAYDLIGNLPMTFGDDNVTIAFHARILTGEFAAFTLEYDLPQSSISMSGNTISVSGSLLPEWCNFLVRQLNLTVVMPEGSSNAVVQGGTVNTSGGKTIASFSNVSLTPFFNADYSLSFSYSPVATMSWGAAIAVIIVVAVAAYLAYLAFRRRRVAHDEGNARAPAQQPSPSRQPPPSPRDHSKGQKAKK